MQGDGILLTPSFHRPWLFGPLDPGNPHWTSPEGKYFLLRPRPHEHPPTGGKPGFPYPADATGDVRNLVGPGGNDSLWLDLGFPVRTAPDGRKYKPLFAPLVLDLDGKLNLNVHGNVAGAGRAHASNQGWGPWEVNLARVLHADPAEWQNLFVGGPIMGRYGPDRQPTGNPAPFGPSPPFYARVDFDGRQRDGSPTPPVLMPGGTSAFPSFPSGYDNADAGERTRHPAIYNVLGTPGRDASGHDRRFAASDVEAFLRHADTGAPGLACMPWQLCPKSFADPRTRRLVTTLSSDARRPGLSPYFWDNSSCGQLVRGPRFPDEPEKLLGGGPRPYPTNPGSRALYDDFTLEGRAGAAPLTRVDLSQPLPAYPPADPTTGLFTDAVAFQAAQQARQALAGELFQRLVRATGAYDPSAYQSDAPWSNAAPPSDAELKTLRWLAQYAANLVDYVDPDDVMTPFPWAKSTGSPAFAAQFAGEWVCGTELPRVVLNEAYAEYLNEPTEVGNDVATGKPKQATRYNVNVWVELHNSLRSDTALRDGGDARLDGVYQLVLSQANRGLLGTNDGMNVLGDPDHTGPNQQYDPTHVYQTLGRFDPPLLRTNDKPGGGFYVVGPPDPAPGADAWSPAGVGTLRSRAFTYQLKVGPGQVLQPPNPTILLRRLACPNLPHQPDPTRDAPLTPYNPLVTVDYLEDVPLAAGITNTGAGKAANRPTPLERRQAVGRVQPFDGRQQTTLPQEPAAAAVGQPQHTLFAHNRDGVFLPRPAFDWLVHLDRPPISPPELLHAACCRPHQLTHLFKNGSNDPYQRFNHAPYWLLRDANSPLHRFLELLETGSRAGGTNGADQVPGKVNLNTVWDEEVFLALCDPQPSSRYTADDVRQIFQWLRASRSPGGAPGPADRPFKSLGSAHFPPSGPLYADGNGLADTLLRDNPRHPLHDPARRPIRLLEVVKDPLAGPVIQDHPYQRYELLTKIFNQTTTRSHVFAVWLTVGFFEVNDDTTRPIKLGAELGRDEGRHVRRRMFALVDRSQLVPIFPAPGEPPITSATPIAAPGSARVVPTKLKGTNPDGVAWRIRPGMVLRVTGRDASGVEVSEDVVVSVADRASFTATFRRAYPQGLASIAAFGNPGPRATLVNPARLPGLVPYFSVLN